MSFPLVRRATYPEDAPWTKFSLVGRRRQSLKVEKGCQIGMVDDGAGGGVQHRRPDSRLGAERDAKACGLQHLHVVGSVADGKDVRGGQTMFGGEVEQQVALGCRIEDGFENAACEAAGFDFEDDCRSAGRNRIVRRPAR